MYRTLYYFTHDMRTYVHVTQYTERTNVPDVGYSRNVSFTLNLVVHTKFDIYVFITIYNVSKVFMIEQDHMVILLT
jgi:hypothetical protein